MTHGEFLAVIWAVLMLITYVEARRFTIRTDHDALRWILNMENVKLSRWLLRLQVIALYVVLLCLGSVCGEEPKHVLTRTFVTAFSFALEDR